MAAEEETGALIAAAHMAKEEAIGSEEVKRINLQEVRAMITDLRERNISIAFVRFPTAPGYRDKVLSQVTQEWAAVEGRLCGLQGVMVWDLEDEVDFRWPQDFRDSTHLNAAGGRKAGRHLLGRIKALAAR